MPALYDTIGLNYADLRRPDPRIAAQIDQALGGAGTVLNVGAGAGSYEPAGRQVTALELSIEMIRQRAPHTAPVVQGRAEQLPFADESFDAAMALLTIHHWSDQAAGLREMRRVSRGPVVLLTFDPSYHRRFWLAEYLPELATVDHDSMPALSEYERWLGAVEIDPVPVPHDCTDGFVCAYWRRPAAYLNAQIRAASSPFWQIENVEGKLAPLAADIDSGAWAARHADLLELESADMGYRLVRTV